jgi:hypothetical protein
VQPPSSGSALFELAKVTVVKMMMVTAPKHAGAVLMSILMYILKLFLRQLTCASIGE